MFEVGPNDQVTVRGFPSFAFPILCPFRSATGLLCPGCGFTRSIVHLAHGDLKASWRQHALGVPLVLYLLVGEPVRRLVAYGFPKLGMSTRLQIILASALLVSFFARWLLLLLGTTNR
jgi:hypothetical protein